MHNVWVVYTVLLSLLSFWLLLCSLCFLCYKCCVVSVICICGCLSVLFFLWPSITRQRREGTSWFAALMLHILIKEAWLDCSVELTFMLLSWHFYRYFVFFFFQIFYPYIHCFACNYIFDKSVFIGLLCLSEFKYLGVLISPKFPGPCVIINK
jgi:hypothetical protein